MSYILEEKEMKLETFFNLLNQDDSIEHYNETESSRKISDYQDNQMNIGLQYLENSEKQIISKNNSIHEINNNTSLLYNYIYTIFITILVIILLGVITYLKNVLNINENMYMTLIFLTLLSYIFFIMYLFNIMYTKDSIQKIINFIRTGRFEFGEITLGKLPQSVYIQQLCKKKKALESTSFEESKSVSPIPNIDDKNHYFYNDNNAPKQQILPNISNNDAKFVIYNVDADISNRQFLNTSRL